MIIQLTSTLREDSISFGGRCWKPTILVNLSGGNTSLLTLDTTPRRFFYLHTRKQKRPNYDYKAEAGKAVTRLRELVGDRERIEMLKFFDNKVLVQFVIQGSLLRG